MYFGIESFGTWLEFSKKLNVLLSTNKNFQYFFMFLLFSLVYGFIIFRFVKLYLDNKKAEIQMKIQLQIEQERTKQIEAASNGRSDKNTRNK